MTAKTWHLIVDRKPLPGSWNMSVDDFLFSVLKEEPETYLRFYAWEKPTVSLGYSQNVEKVVDVDYCREHGIDIVRRITGGKLVLHNKEVTYSVCSSDTGLFSANLPDSYRRISEALILGLKKMGLEPCLADAAPQDYVRGNLPCFSYPAKNEIEVDNKKIIGSAQKRIGNIFLQHGSIPLEEDDDLLRAVSYLNGKKERVRMLPLNRALDAEVKFTEVVHNLAAGFSEYFGIGLVKKIFSAKELGLISRIQKEKHDNQNWILAIQ